MAAAESTSSTDGLLGCAVRTDGTLKDASEIIWHFDKDDNAPMVSVGSRRSGRSATPSERAFSGGGLTDTVRRNRLSTGIFEAIQILKSAYRNNHATAIHEAAEHVDARLVAFDNDDSTSFDA